MYCHSCVLDVLCTKQAMYIFQTLTTVVTVNGKQRNASPHNQTPPIKCTHNALGKPKGRVDVVVEVVALTLMCMWRWNYGSHVYQTIFSNYCSHVYQTIFSKRVVAMYGRRKKSSLKSSLSLQCLHWGMLYNLRPFISTVLDTGSVALSFTRSSTSLCLINVTLTMTCRGMYAVKST